MSRIASVDSRKLITRVFAAMALLQTFTPVSMIGLTGALAIIGASSAAAEPLNYYNYRNRSSVVSYSRGPMIGVGGLSIGPSLGVGSSRNVTIAPSSGANGLSNKPSGSVRAIKNTSGSRLSADKINISPTHWKRNAIQAPKSTPIALNPKAPTAAGPKSGSILAGPTNTSAPNGEMGRITGSQGGFDKQGPASQGGGPVLQQGPSRDSAVFRDDGGATSSKQSTGVARDNTTASRDGKSVSRDTTTTPRDGKAASRDNATGSGDGKTPSRDTATESGDGKAASRDTAATASDKAGGGSRDSTVASKDGTSGGPIKAEDIRRAMDRCAQTYVSYDRATMTYLDLNGDKQSCP